MPECRTCGAPITWARTHKDKTMPLDADPVPTGDFVIVAHVATPHGMAPLVEKVTADTADRDRYTTHFVTCPDRDEHRRPR